MNARSFPAFGICVLALLFFATGSAHAQATKIFVASFGSDANDGSRGSPKRNFQAAHDAVAVGGEIVALDTAGYGQLTISKSVGITAPAGITGFITAATGPDAILVNANPTDTVTLRGLTLTAAGSTTGIRVVNVGTIEVNNCVISGFAENLRMIPSSAATLLVRNTTSRDASALISVPINAPAAVKIVIDGCRLVGGNTSGVSLPGTNPLAHRITIRDTVVTGCGIGIALSGPSARVDLLGCTLSANTTGINVQTSGTSVKVDDCVVTNNTTGLIRGTGTLLLSRSNNTVEDNDTNGTFSGNYTAK